jgi:hypothetical protein
MLSRYNVVVPLTERQASIVTGTLLGDGSMRCKRNALLEINHSHAQRSYVDWKYRELQSFVSSPPRKRDGNGGRIAYRFTTRSQPEFTPLYQLFYHGGKKVVYRIRIRVGSIEHFKALISDYVLPEFRYKIP